MRSQIADDPVALIEPEIHPRRSDEVDVSELAGADQVADLVHRRAVQERVPGHQRRVDARRASSMRLLGIFGRCGERFFDQHMLPGFEARQHKVAVVLGGVAIAIASIRGIAQENIEIVR